MGYRLSGVRCSGGRAGQGVTSPGLERAQELGPDLESQSLPLPRRVVPGAARGSLSIPFGPGSRSNAPSCPRGPFLGPPLLPPLSAAVTKLSSRTAVLVRPPLPTARGGSHGSSQRPRWLQSRHFSGSGRPNPHPPRAADRPSVVSLIRRHLSWTLGGTGDRSGPFSLSF